MLCDSSFEIPKAAASDRNTPMEPYVADAYEAICMFSQRKTGTRELVAWPRVTMYFNPTFVERAPGNVNEN